MVLGVLVASVVVGVDGDHLEAEFDSLGVVVDLVLVEVRRRAAASRAAADPVGAGGPRGRGRGRRRERSREVETARGEKVVTVLIHLGCVECKEVGALAIQGYEAGTAVVL